METKYTAFLAPAVMLLYALLFCRPVLGLVAVLTAGLFFASWEWFIAAYHGDSHFLVNLRDQSTTLDEKGRLFWPFVSIVGGVSPPLTLFGLAALGVRGRTVAILGIGLSLGYGLLADTALPHAFSEAIAGLSLESLIFGIFGVLSLGVTVAVMGGLLRGSDDADVEEPASAYPWWQSPFFRIDLFVVLWLLGEVAGYFLLTPFPAVRRVMGVMIVGTLLAGRLAARTCMAAPRRRLIAGVTAFGIALGFGFYGVDLLDAFASKRLAENAAAHIREQDPHARIWYVGHWGFQYYAEQAGMIPVVPDGSSSRLMPGDCLVVPEPRLEQQRMRVEPYCMESDVDIIIEDRVPLRMVQCYYGGYVPLEHHDGPRARATIYRIIAPFTARYGG
jgi:hypothetical protein